MAGLKTTAAAIVASLALSACVIAPYPRYAGYDGYDSELAVAGYAPPAPYVEVRPSLPYAGAIWIDGYWGWSRGRYAWVGGHWDRPRPGYAWAPHRWVQRSNQWHLYGGGWVRR